MFAFITSEKVHAEEETPYAVASITTLTLTGMGVAAAIYVVAQYLTTAFSQSTTEKLNFTAIYNKSKQIIQEAPDSIVNSIIASYLAAKVSGLSTLTLSTDVKTYLSDKTEATFDALYPSVIFQSASSQYTLNPELFTGLIIPTEDSVWSRFSTDLLEIPAYNGVTDDEQYEYNDTLSDADAYLKSFILLENYVSVQAIRLQTAENSPSIYLPAFNDYFNRLYIERTDNAQQRVDKKGKVIDGAFFYLYVKFSSTLHYGARTFLYRSTTPWVLPNVGAYINNPSDTAINFAELIAWLDANAMGIELITPQGTLADYNKLITERDNVRSIAKSMGVAKSKDIGSVSIVDGIPLNASYDGRAITYSEDTGAWTYTDTGVAVPGLRDIYDKAVSSGKNDVDTEKELGGAINWTLTPALTGDVEVGEGEGTGEGSETDNPSDDNTGFFGSILSFIKLILAALYAIPGEVRDSLSDLWIDAGLIWSGIKEAVLNLPTRIADALSSLWEDAGIIWTGILDTLMDLPTSITNSLTGLWTDAGIIWTGISDKLSGLPDAISGALSGLWSGTLTGLKSIAQILQDIWTWLLSLPLVIQEAIVNSFTWAFVLEGSYVTTRLGSLKLLLSSKFINWGDTKEFFTGYKKDMDEWPGIFANFSHYDGVGEQMVVSNVAPNHYARQIKKWIGAMFYFITLLFVVRKMATLIGSSGGD